MNEENMSFANERIEFKKFSLSSDSRILIEYLSIRRESDSETSSFDSHSNAG